MSQAKGSRINALEVRNRTSGQWAAIDPSRSYVVVTHDFIASGQDGYATFGTIYKAGQYVNTYLLYSQTFIDYIKAKGSMTRVARTEYSHKSVITKSGIRLSE